MLNFSKLPSIPFFKDLLHSLILPHYIYIHSRIPLHSRITLSKNWRENYKLQSKMENCDFCSTFSQDPSCKSSSKCLFNELYSSEELMDLRFQSKIGLIVSLHQNMNHLHSKFEAIPKHERKKWIDYQFVEASVCQADSIGGCGKKIIELSR